MSWLHKVVSLELSKALKDLGIEHSKANLSWIKHDYQKNIILASQDIMVQVQSKVKIL